MKSFLDWFFRTKDGRFVIMQFPNWPLWVAIACYVLLKFVDGPLGIVLFIAMKVVLIYWAILEIVSGVNNWRRLLGLVVFVWVIYTLINQYLI